MRWGVRCDVLFGVPRVSSNLRAPRKLPNQFRNPVKLGYNYNLQPGSEPGCNPVKLDSKNGHVCAMRTARTLHNSLQVRNAWASLEAFQGLNPGPR